MRLDRRTAWAVVLVAATVFVVLAVTQVPWDRVPGGDLRPARASDLFTPDQIARAEEYSTTRRYLGWASYAVSLLVAALLGFTPRGAALVRRMFGSRRWWLVVMLATLLVLALGRLATLPFAVAHHARRLEFGLSEQPWGAWIFDLGRSLLVSWFLTALVLLVLVLAARRSPRWWFAWAGVAAVVLTLAGSFLYPVVVEPVFNDFEPLPEGELRSSVLTLAERQGVEIDEILVSDASQRTTTYNAYVSGFGDTRRVVLYDTLVEDLPLPEAEVVVAHELAHAKHNDVLVGTVLGASGAVLGVALLALVMDSTRLRRRLGIRGLGDPAAVPLVLALWAVALLAVSPVEAGISRAIETRADRDALAATGESTTFVDMQRELALKSLSDPTPPAWSQFWFGSHPTVLERAGLPASLERAGDDR